MGIAGLGTYSNASFYYAGMYSSKTSGVETDKTFDATAKENDNSTAVQNVSNKTSAVVAYSRCITATIKTEEVVGSEAANGEMIYSYKASEQSFNIWINSDGEKKTYAIEGIDKDGNPFTKEFNPYDVDPEDADFPEFAALCMYIQNTDETADMLANEYFQTDDILEKENYLDKLQGFTEDSFFAKAKSMLDNANKLIESFEHIMSMKNDVNSLFESFFTKYLVEEVSEEDYPDVAGKVSEELSSEEIKEISEPKEVITPLGIGFALAGEMGYGMSASLVEVPGSDDTIVRVKIATGKGDETIDVNLSEFDPKNATPVEMFAYCQYMDAIGEGVDNKWGSWHAMKQMASPYDGFNFGTLDDIMNKKIDWSGKLSESQTSWVDPKTNKTIMTPADLLKLLEESHKLTAKELKEEKDWREMSDEEWDNMLEGIDKYIDAFKERLKQMREMQEEAAKKASAEADSDMKAAAASSAALAVASGTSGETSEDADSDENVLPSEDGEKREKNWTKKLDTDDQTILMTAQEAQKKEQMAMSKFQELQVTDSTTVGVSTTNGVTECASVDEKDDKDKVWTITAFGADGISSQRCQNGKILDSWEIKFKNQGDAKRVNDFISQFSKDADLKFAGSKEFWTDFIDNNLNAHKIFKAHGDMFEKASAHAPKEVEDAWINAAKETGYLEGGKMNHISQLLIRQATNRAKGIEDYQNVFGNSVESSLQAAKELLNELENPLTPVSERGEDAREYIEQEKVFYKKFIENLENIA